MASLARDGAVHSTSSHTYAGVLSGDWVTGQVPHGGYTSTMMMNVISLHFNTTLKAQNQPHTMMLHIEYLRRTWVGPAEFIVEDKKIGRATSTVLVTLKQNGQEEMVAYATNTNMSKMKGVNLPTDYPLVPPRIPIDLAAAADGKDQNWSTHAKFPYTGFNHAIRQVEIHLPRNGMPRKSIYDEWIRMKSGERFTNSSLGYVSDMWPTIGEAYRYDVDPYAVDNPDTNDERKGSAFWYPTLSNNLEFKKPLPEEGVEWLFARVEAREIRNGRLDFSICIMDAEGDLVCLGKQVVMILPAARNLDQKKNESKI